MSDKVKMIADTKLCQDGEWYRAGLEFECSAGDADDLDAMGMAHRAPGVIEETVERVKRQYRRRDMTAQ